MKCSLRKFVMVNGASGFRGSHLCEDTGPVSPGNPGESPIRALAQKVTDMTGLSSKLAFKPMARYDPTQRRPDICLARPRLGWEPTVNLEARLATTIGYFEEFLRRR